MKLSYTEQISITGNSRNRKIFFRSGTERQPLTILPAENGPGWYTKNGEAYQRTAFKEWVADKFDGMTPGFDDIFNLVKASNPKPRNPKAMLWLK